jgi:2-methylisocitrate lyase-like PEP mutase family enzyme
MIGELFSKVSKSMAFSDSANSNQQKERAERFRRLHQKGSPLLVLPNAWDAASARIFAQLGFAAIATTSSGVATALGYPDGERISRDLLIEAVTRITRVVDCPVSVDVESGYGASIPAIEETLEMVVAAGGVGINVEDSRPASQPELVDTAYQIDLIARLRAKADSLGVPVVINARTDVFLLEVGEPNRRVELAVERAAAYLGAGADSVYPIGALPRQWIADLASAIPGPINILAGPSAPPLHELADLGVARVTFGGGLMRAALGHVQAAARELLEQGTYTVLGREILSGKDFEALFS